jgi:hypothetical protein
MEWICTNEPINIITNGGYTLEQILANKHCSKDSKYWIPILNTNKYLFKSSVAESWEFLDPLIKNPISNTNQIYLRFLDSFVFTEARDTFKLSGYYCSAPEDTIAFNQYWDEQEEYCEYGLEVDGVRITGRYYWWLNFGRLKATDLATKRKFDKEPSFVDHQYYWSLELEESCLEGVYANVDIYLNYFPNKNSVDYRRLKKEGMVVAKGRRKGYSYFKASAFHAYNFTWLADSKNILAAYEKSHYGTPLKAIHDNLNFLNKNTPWVRRRDKLNTRTHFRASVEVINEFGVKVEEGYMSELNCISFMDDPFKGIGDSADFIDIEEAGKFMHLLETYEVSIEPVIRDGDIMIGIPLIGGTAGDMDKGSIDLYTIFSDPKSYRLKGYSNIYDDKPNETVGWFIDDMWYLPGFLEKELIKELFPNDSYILNLINKYEGDVIETVDIQGNSHRRFSEILIDEKRKIKKKGDARAYNKFISQQPKTVGECFLVTEGSPFEVRMAKERLSELKIKASKSEEWGEFIVDNNNLVQWRNDFTMQPIVEFPIRTKDINLDGCWVIYEKPIKDKDGKIPWSRYLANCDPIDKGEDEVVSKDEHSLASTFIMDAFTRKIVAEYSGRPGIAEQYYEQLWRGIEYYNAELLYENNLKGLYTHFRNKNKLHLLANEPISLKDRGYNYTGNNTKGYHATPQINSFGRELINKWTLENHIIGQDTNTGENFTIPKMYTIDSIPLLQEIINWKPKLNCDRISALGGCLILLNDREIFLQDRVDRVNSRIKDSTFFKRIQKYTTKTSNKDDFFKQLKNR